MITIKKAESLQCFIKHIRNIGYSASTFTSIAKPTLSNKGLFSCNDLRYPKDFSKLSRQMNARTDHLINMIRQLNDKRIPLDKRKCNLLLYLLDSISNEICVVVDAAELCRNIHDKDEFRQAAEMTFSDISSIDLNKINSNSDLYETVKRIYDDDKLNRQDVSNKISNDNDNTLLLLSDEDLMFIQDLKYEFESEGIHLSSVRDKELLTQLQTDIVALETQIVNNISMNDNQIFRVYDLPHEESAPLSNWMKRFIDFDSLGYFSNDHNINDIAANNTSEVKNDINSKNNSSLLCISNKRISIAVLKSLRQEDHRQQIYLHTCFEPYDNISKLGLLIKRRHEWSKLLGYQSYAHKILNKQTIKTPEKVMSILHTLSQATRIGAENEYIKLEELKYQYEKKNLNSTSINNNNKSQLNPWDISYYSYLYNTMKKESNSNATNKNKRNDDIRHYFSLKNCLNGLSMITHELFDIDFIYTSFSPHESWMDENTSSTMSSTTTTTTTTTANLLSQFLSSSFSSSNNNIEGELNNSLKSGIFKFEVYNSNQSNKNNNNLGDNNSKKRNINDLIGIVYLDLYQRQRQPGQQTKFPGAAMFTIACGCRNSFHENQSTNSSTSTSTSSSSASASSINMENITYQLPRIALVLNFYNNNTINNDGSFLTLQEVETLHHEWGHMLHSLLSRTKFQHLSGTRTAVDFSEVSRCHLN